MRNQSTQEFILDKKIESDQESISTGTTKRELQFVDRGRRRKKQSSEYKEPPFQQGLPLKEDNKSKIPNHDRKIFMAILSEPGERKENPAALEDLDYDDLLSDTEFLHRHQESRSPYT